MVIIKRDDGFAINLAAAVGFTEVPQGMVVQFPPEEFGNDQGSYYIVEGFTWDIFKELVRGRFATSIITERFTFRSWPQ